jgi:sugar phosphate isomerase/epimerase
VDAVWFLDTYGKRIVFLHPRDQHADGRWSEALGEGDMAYAAIARALQRIGFSGVAVAVDNQNQEGCKTSLGCSSTRTTSNPTE